MNINAATQNEVSNIATVPTAPKAQTAREFVESVSFVDMGSGDESRQHNY